LKEDSVLSCFIGKTRGLSRAWKRVLSYAEAVLGELQRVEERRVAVEEKRVLLEGSFRKLILPVVGSLLVAAVTAVVSATQIRIARKNSDREYKLALAKFLMDQFRLRLSKTIV
jgi:hypothetical protein